MTTNGVIDSVKSHRPKDVRELLLDCKVTLKYLDSGSFRDVYEIVGHPLVVKFPNCKAGVRHSNHEVSVYNRIKNSKKKYIELQKHLPDIHYTNRYGVVLMTKYSPFGDTERSGSISLHLESEVSKILGLKDGWDAHYGNFGRDSKGKVVLLDFGYLEGAHR